MITTRQPAGGGRGPERQAPALQALALLGASTLIAIAGHNLDSRGVFAGHLGDGSYVPFVASVASLGSVVFTHKRHPLSEVLTALVLGAGWETAQQAHIVPGQFDLVDTLAYGAGGAAYLGLSALVSRAIPEQTRR